MTLSLPFSVYRLAGSPKWHVRLVGNDGLVSRLAICGAGLPLTGMAVGTEGLDMCERCAEPFTPRAKAGEPSPIQEPRTGEGEE
jgi:hypothetical protein